MTSSELLILFLAACAGLLLGGISFGGLWWTVKNGITAKQPDLWFLGSMIVRMTIVMAGFYFVGGGQWERILSCLVGFITARSIIVRLTRSHHRKTHIRGTGLEACTALAIRFQKESHHAN